MSTKNNFWLYNSRIIRSIALVLILSVGMLALVLSAAAQEGTPATPQGPSVPTNSWGNPLHEEINYQGQLVDSNGLPQVGSYTMEFAILGGPPDYTLLYTETQTVSTDQDGLFNLMIGAVQPGLGDALLSGEAWLEVKLDGEILAPRQPVGSVAYALYAQHLVGGNGQYSVLAGGDRNSADGRASVSGGGLLNVVSGNWATISGGASNVATGTYSTVGGGLFNDAIGDHSTIAGGRQNRATETNAFVGGGLQNGADSVASSVVGGFANYAYAESASVGGGSYNHAAGLQATVGGGYANEASGESSTVGGGSYNDALNLHTTVSGGNENTASANRATVSGGDSNTASGLSATVVGGRYNTASGDGSTVLGGGQNIASGLASAAAGYNAQALHNYAFVWSDGPEFASTAPDQFLISAHGGVGINTNAPQTQFHVFDSINGFANDLGAHVVSFTNDATGSSPDVLALQVSEVTDPAVSINYITFFDASGAIAAIEGNGSGGVAYNTSGADFAEYLPLASSITTDLLPGTVLGLTGGSLHLDTAAAQRVLVVSGAPGFVGNADEAEGNAQMALAAFMGQVPVRVRGPVQAGDLLVASGLNDGTAVAILPVQLTPTLASQIVGQALESSSASGIHLVNTLVGQPSDAFWAARLATTETQLAELEARLADLEAALQNLTGAGNE